MKKNYLLLTCILSFCSISYELLFANTLAIMSGNVVLWHSLTIGIYIAGLGLGTFRSIEIVLPRKKLIRVELLLCLIGAISVGSIYFITAIYETTLSIAKAGYIADYSTYITLKTQIRALYFILCESLVFAVGYLSGFELPLIMAMASSDLSQDKLDENNENQFIAFNYFGTLIGTLVFAYLLIPQIDALYTSLVVASINLLACLWLVLAFKVQSEKRIKAAIMVFGVLLSFSFVYAKQFEQIFLRVYYRAGTTFIDDDRHDLKSWWKFTMDKGDVVRLKTLYQYIDYFNVSWKGNDEFILMINTNFQFSSLNERYYHEGFAHIPVLITGKEPINVLVLGAGDGLLLRELKKYDSIKSMTHVELDPQMHELSKNNEVISALNEGALTDPSIETVFTDAFQFLRKSTKKYDAIFIDFPYPQDYNVSKLFSYEFYTFVRRNLTPNGYAVFDVPLRTKEGSTASESRRLIELHSTFTDSDFERNSIVMSTVAKAGFKIRIPYLVGKETFLLMTNTEEQLNYDLFGKLSDRYPTLDNDALSLINRQYFPHVIADEYVNSVFHPILVD